MPGSEFDESEPPILDGEPEGWRELQKRARNAKDGRELGAIIAEMNQLLTQCEKRAAAADALHPAPGRGGEKRTPSDE